MLLRPMLQVADVEASSRWYQEILGLVSGHGGDEFEMLLDGETVLLQLHGSDAHVHGILHVPADSVRGQGVSLWFEVPDKVALDAIAATGQAAGAVVGELNRWNPLAHHHEVTLVDPDGYVVVINTPYTAS